MDRAAYERYLAAFNARDYDAVLAHFADRFEVVFAGYAFRTADQVRDFYRFFHACVDERITLKAFLSNETMVALEADVRLEAHEDLTPAMLEAQGLGGLFSLAKGQVITVPQFIHYHLDANGKIVRALCAVYEPPRS